MRHATGFIALQEESVVMSGYAQRVVNS